MGRSTRKARTSSAQLRLPVTPSAYGENGNDALLLTVKEAAALMRIGRDTAYALVAQRRIPCVKLGKQIRIPRRALIAHLEKEAVQLALGLEGGGAT